MTNVVRTRLSLFAKTVVCKSRNSGYANAYILFPIYIFKWHSSCNSRHLSCQFSSSTVVAYPSKLLEVPYVGLTSSFSFFILLPVTGSTMSPVLGSTSRLNTLLASARVTVGPFSAERTT
ncbi:hypothetical protein PUN28_002479 [Cardiocondyla obscurior]|uniref:Uncharacterized protein n=1 Tax=Cardiocondyla obscurior TaxID=286306 RepID=A0AAW2GUG5_9HYME